MWGRNLTNELLRTLTKKWKLSNRREATKDNAALKKTITNFRKINIAGAAKKNNEYVSKRIQQTIKVQP